MRHKTPGWLENIRAACEFIMEATDGKTLKDYQSDLKLRYSVERCFLIIGEAAGRISRFDPDIASRIGDCSRIISFRNVLIHGYDIVDENIVWMVILEHLPTLKSQVEEILNEG